MILKIHEYRRISEEEFWKKIKNRDGDFVGYCFNFEIDFKDIDEIDFELNFSKSIFKKKIWFRKTVFKKSFIVSKAVFESAVEFFGSIFNSNFSANSSQFKKVAIFNLVNFNSRVDFNKAKFFTNTYFKKTRFLGFTSFQKTQFYSKTDFSYADFSNTDLTSFISVNDTLFINGEKLQPLFIFKTILFSKSTVFNDVDLGRSVFQDSIIDDIIFKDCRFPKIDGRNSFYTELAETKEFILDDLSDLLAEKINTIIVSANEDIARLNLSDRILIKERNSNKTEKFFIVTKFEFDSLEKAQEKFDYLNQERNFVGVKNIFSKICIEGGNCENKKVVALRLKKFIPEKHWLVLEDLYRQMKRSLEDSRDWQMAGDFYKGEMNAKINLLKVKREDFPYRCALKIYKKISYFGESVTRILIMIIISGFFGTILLALFKPEMSFLKAVSANISLYMPIFGSNTVTISSLKLLPWQEIIVYAEVAWFYFLWLILAITIRRRFKR